MDYYDLPGVEKPIPRLVQGTVYFSEENPDEAFECFDAVFEHGGTMFDTAHHYGSGSTERVLGMWIEKNNIRDEVIILGKGAHPYDDKVRVTPEFITADLHESLERLRTDYIDLYLLHRDDETKPVEPLVDILNEHLAAGKIHAFGGSNWTTERISEANRYANANGLKPFVASSPQFSLAEMVKPAWPGCIGIGGHAGEAARQWYHDNDVALFPWSSLAGGFMTGHFRRDNLAGMDDYFETVTIDAYCYEDNFIRLDRAELLAKDYGVSLPEIALAYVLRQPLKLSAVVGSRKPEEFRQNAAALEIKLTPEEIAWLELKTGEKPS